MCHSVVYRCAFPPPAPTGDYYLFAVMLCGRGPPRQGDYRDKVDSFVDLLISDCAKFGVTLRKGAYLMMNPTILY